MALNPKLWPPLTLMVLACHHPPPAGPKAVRCAPQVPATAEHPIGSSAESLAGTYDLIQVRTQPDSGTSTGRLHLLSLDSTSRGRMAGGPARDLRGWLEPTGGDSAWRSNVGSRDPMYPGVVLTGDHLRLGQATLDGYSEHLTITAVAPEGFWGWWRAMPGFDVSMDSSGTRALPDPAGYFCALRVTEGP